MSTYQVTLAEDVYNVSVTTVEVVNKVYTNIDVYYVTVAEDSYKLITQEEETYNIISSTDVYNISVGEEEVYNVTVIMSGGSATGGIASISDLIPAGDFNNQLITWSVLKNVWIKNSTDYLDATSVGGSGVPEYFLIEGVDSSEGYNSFTDPVNNWNTSKAIVKHIHIETDSTDWFLKLLPKANGVAGLAPETILMDHGNLGETIYVDKPYEDEDSGDSVHLQFIDYGASHLFSVSILGTELL